MTEPQPERKRRVRYKGAHPRRFEEKYKELNPEKYADDLTKIIASGKTPAGTHRPILVQEVLKVLSPKPGQIGLDCTLGYGGHACELLECIRPGGKLFAIDVDPIEIVKTEERLRKLGYSESELMIRRLNFAGIKKLLPDCGGGFDFLLADLGVSSMQLDNPARGFSYKTAGPLDFRLNPKKGRPASAIVTSLSEEKLEKMLRENSEEPHSMEIAKAIYDNRYRLTTTTILAETVRETLSGRKSARPEAEVTRSIRRTFQALRIEVNDELFALEQFLRNLPFVMKPGGRVVILSFHSGEDKRVAKFFEEGFGDGLYQDFSREPIQPGPQECYNNPRARSALLRWATRSY